MSITSEADLAKRVTASPTLAKNGAAQLKYISSLIEAYPAFQEAVVVAKTKVAQANTPANSKRRLPPAKRGASRRSEFTRPSGSGSCLRRRTPYGAYSLASLGELHTSTWTSPSWGPRTPYYNRNGKID